MMDYLAETPAAEPVRFAMRELVEEIAESAGIEVRYDGPDEVRLDRTMMSRILLNLARNAANAGASKISIDVWRAGQLGVIDWHSATDCSSERTICGAILRTRGSSEARIVSATRVAELRTLRMS